MTERTGITSIKGNPLTLLGEEIKVGQKAPNFKVRTGLAPNTEITLDSSKGKVRVFNVVPSLDTGVCEAQTIRFNEEAVKLGDGVEIMTVSMDLPPAQGRFCGHQLKGAAKIKMASDYAEKSFAMNYGILLKEWQVCGRGVFVVDKNDTVKYVQYCPKIEEQPDFDKALQAIKSLL
ncbi:thiol peroxidase [bacterium]|nr:thiol peroxidase [bacterium]